MKEAGEYVDKAINVYKTFKELPENMLSIYVYGNDNNPTDRYFKVSYNHLNIRQNQFTNSYFPTQLEMQRSRYSSVFAPAPPRKK